MSQNPAHTPRRALSPPAVTRFQLRTASATEAVFSPPYVPAPHDPVRPAAPPHPEPVAPEPFPEPTIRRQPTALPPGTPPRELPRPEPPIRALELPPLRESGIIEPARSDIDRTEPGTWREIIARFERELGPVTEADEETADALVPHEAEAPPSEAQVPSAAPEAPESEAEVPSTDAESHVERAPEAEAEVVPAEPEAPQVEADAARPADARTASPVEPGEPPLLDEPVPWEFEAMTTPDYTAPQSIHDAGHDSWPVEAEDGDAVPAWSDEAAHATGQPDETFDEIGELLLDEVVPADPWDREPDFDEPAPTSDFPLDAFIVPAGVQSVTGFGEDDVARRVALRLDEIARDLRDGGLRSLGRTDSIDELSRVLAAIVTGYVSRGA